MKNFSIIFISSEIYPFSKSGGLGDVMGILPETLAEEGLDVSIITPLYGRITATDYQIRLIYENCPVGYPWPDIGADIYQADFNQVKVYFVDRPEFFDRKNYYCTYHGDYFDNCERFIFFCRASLAWAGLMAPAPSIIHAHDWHTALVPAYLYFQRLENPFWKNTASVLTIHNLAFQGHYSARLFWESGLPAQAWSLDGAEYYGGFNMLKAGIAYSDMITTVSPTYAKEILTSQFGCGLEGILRKRFASLRGILNGVDYTSWDPRHDLFLPHLYSPKDLSGKELCKEHLIGQMGLHPKLKNRPILGFIGRLRDQKGIDLLIDILPQLMENEVGLVVLGEGALEAETLLANLVEQYPGYLAAYIGYTEEKAHQIIAGSDIFLMPSRYEPCGLTQLYSMCYGTLPVASMVGGLNDTLLGYPHPECTGFTFEPTTAPRFLEAVLQAVAIWTGHQKQWRKMQQRAMDKDFSWKQSSRNYIEIYRELFPKGII